jgi:uncharacterized protein YerC
MVMGYNGISGINGIRSDMINKADEIRKLLKQNKTTRYIAQKVGVSLRDIHRVRQQENIDIGAIERQKARAEDERAEVVIDIVKKRDIAVQLEKKINDLRKTLTSLEAAIQRKQTEIKYVRQPVERIYFPENYDEVRKYLETLSQNQLLSISTMITDILNDRVVQALHDEATRMRKETEETINRLRNSLRP